MNKMKKMLCAFLAMVMVAGVCVMPTEARSGNANVKVVQEAIDNAENGTTVTLTEDLLWGDGEPVEIPSGKNITIDLNGYKMESLEPYPIFCVMSGAEMTIKSSVDTSIAKNTGIPEEYQEYYDAETMGLFEVQENAKLTIKSGEYEAGDNYFTGNSAGEVILEGGFYNKVPEGTYTVKSGYEFTSANRNGVDVWTISEAAPDITPPVIESLVFEQDGIVLNKNEQISFILKGYDADSEITKAAIVANGDKVGFSGDGVVTPIAGEENTYKVTFDAYCPGEFDRIYIEIIDAAGNFTSYDFDKISLIVEEVIIYADVKGEIIVPDHDIVLTEDDISEFELLGNYFKDEYFYIELEGDYSQVYKSAGISVLQENGTQFTSIYFLYDEDKSTSDKTVYTGRLTVNEDYKSAELSLSDIEFYREEGTDGERATFEKKTVKYIKDLGDDEAPKIEKVTINKQGEHVSGGTVTVTIEASDNKELRNAKGCYVDFQAGLYNISTEESWKIFSLEYVGNNIYTVTINVSELYPTEWFLDAVSITDFAGNETRVWLNTTSPYYFYVEKDGVCNPQVYKDATIIIYNSDNVQVTSFKKDLERRSTIQDVIPTEYLNGSQTDKGEFLGWQIKGEEEIFTKDSQFLLDDFMSHYNIQLQEVYEKTSEKEPTPETDSNVTIVEDEKTEETVQQETEKLIMDVLTGRVSHEVVDEKTAENIYEAVREGKAFSTEIVVKEMQQDEIAQIEQSAIEEKVTSELGTDAKVQYLDVSIILKADDEELGTLNKLEEEITITLVIPDALKAESRTYKIIRNHNGVVDVLDTVVNGDGTISFKTDRFSTYALAYADEENEGAGTNQTPENKPSTENNKPSADAKAPQTGDNNSTITYVVICLIALVAILVIKKRSLYVK